MLTTVHLYHGQASVITAICEVIFRFYSTLENNLSHSDQPLMACLHCKSCFTDFLNMQKSSKFVPVSGKKCPLTLLFIAESII